MKSKLLYLCTALTTAMLMTGTASAATVSSPTAPPHSWPARKGKPFTPPALMGTITSINGSTLTVSGKNGTTYTVDSSKATLHGFVKGKQPGAITLADLAVGDMISADGTLSGTNLTPTTIFFGMPMKPKTNAERGDHARPVMGTIGTVSGSTFTVTVTRPAFHKGTTPTAPTTSTYTVNVTSATTFTKDGQAATLSDVASGVRVAVAGTIDSTSSSVSATKVSIFTQAPTKPTRTRGPKQNLMGTFHKQ